ncbi:hypothetical protein EHR01_10550 [Leptospira mtsangambouensis]|uniref:Uncharacterized protein n=1 Tax=Leptospira mtsangambouensis TaxID=2484912 RepID=A0ABY2NZM0_9LEPT|nr:hypothetical protein [Leptospira mtsangambouensis]TGM74392.1 hypothetical protein EHR01_10550 [Leptospira mtsangambouensis]
MNSSDQEQISRWRERWLAMISYFACYKIQKKMWLDVKNTNPHWSFVELMCCYFDDLGLREDDICLNELLLENYITRKELDAVKKLHQEAALYFPPNSDEYNHQNILNDPKWTEIINLANDTKSNLKNLIKNNLELEKLDHYEMLYEKI